MGKCKSCIHWYGGHAGVWDSEKYGTCGFLTTVQVNRNLPDVLGLCEGCVDVKDRVSEFEFLTKYDFGCTNHKTKTT